MGLGVSPVIDSLVGGFVGGLSYDDVEVTPNNLVVVGCANRSPERVVGYLAEPLTLGSSPQYEAWLGDKVGSVMNLLNIATMAATGTTVRQPWFDRPTWTKTPPLKFSVKLQFVAVNNPEQDVFRPCEALIGYTFPRLSTRTAGTYILNYHPPGPNLFTGYDGDGKVAGGSDYCTLDVGNMISLDICAITNVRVVFSPTLDPNGFPLSATATVEVQASDVGVAQSNGIYQLTQKSGPTLNVDALGTFFGELVGTMADTAGAAFEKLSSFDPGGLAKDIITAFKGKK